MARYRQPIGGGGPLATRATRATFVGPGAIAQAQSEFFDAAAAGSPISGTASGAASVTGTITARGALVGTASGVATVSGTITARGALAGTSAGVATVAGTLRTLPSPIAGTAAGVATATGTLRGVAVCSGAAAGAAPGGLREEPRC